MPVLITLGHHCSDKEQSAEWAEREVIKIKLLHFLNKKIGEVMPGVISGVTPEGFYVRGTRFPAEGFVSVKSLPTDRYRFEKRGQVLEGFKGGNRFRLGDELSVEISEVDLPRRALMLRVVKNHTARSEMHAPKRPKSGKATKKPVSKLRAKYAGKKQGSSKGSKGPSKRKRKGR